MNLTQEVETNKDKKGKKQKGKKQKQKGKKDKKRKDKKQRKTNNWFHTWHNFLLFWTTKYLMYSLEEKL